MQHKGRNSLITTVEKLIRSVNVAPDCQIEAHLLNADPEIVEKLGLDVRIVEVNGDIVTDSGELREYLLSHDGNTNVKVSYEYVDERADYVDIANSVNFNGRPSLIAPQQSSEIVMGDLMDEDPLPIRRHRSPHQSTFFRGSPFCLPLLSTGNNIGQDGTKSSGDDDSISVASSSEFTTDLVGSQLQVTGRESLSLPKTVTPSLLEFEKIPSPLQTDDIFRSNGGRLLEHSRDSSLRRRIMRAVDSVAIGACVICVCQDVNPIAELELTAMVMQAQLVTVNLGAKLRQRPKPEVFAEKFKDAMREGAWFVLLNAHKSIATCRVLEELLSDAASRNFEGFNGSARTIICLEPHPHFPRSLIKGAEVTKIQCAMSSSSSSSQSSFSLATSVSRNRLVTAESWCSRRSSNLSMGGSSFLAGGEAPISGNNKRKVRINASVDVVDIAPREIVAAPPRERSFHASGSVALRIAFAGISDDKFLCVSSAGEKGRFAVGSSMGNVYFVDELGNSLMQAHAHDTSIWDLSFSDKYHFATGCEDGNCIEWAFESGGTEGAVLVPSMLTSLGSDAYCVTYLCGVNPSPLLIGGLSHTLLLRGTDGTARNIEISSNAQVMDTFPSGPLVLVGGSDGSVTAIDTTTATCIARFKEHTRKLPALTIRNHSHFFTGSFDSKILSWDYRTPQKATGEVAVGDGPTASPIHTLKMKGYVTGLHVDDVHLAASVGENLYLWDVRKLSEVLGGYPQAWKGLSRGLQVSSASQCVVTASQDGHVRFWNFV
ncbi:Dynein heavy chain region D6 P-loop domain [Trypanosoma melophagium]|uniref:Dynein heavy chain region D6 P-loop domain n=1 Tax=Trypanosoma melophagium TaxID=715481 RepID=UPI00351AADD9|nr:Dynein heavy chain region D6 P-loop domain [Trypanosoma melophagium]